MAEIVILSFNDPVLAPGEKFRISYENLGTSIVVNLPDHIDNSDLAIQLEPGHYRFTIQVVKANGELCPPSIIDYMVNVPPVEPPIDPPVDPPITIDVPCKCPTVADSKIVVSCEGLISLLFNMNYPETNQPCKVKIWVRYATSGAGSTPILNQFNSLQSSYIVALSGSNFVQYKIVMYCCTDSTETECSDWVTVTDIERCSCIAPGISVISSTYPSLTTTMLTINIAASVPSLPPYTVSFLVGGFVHSQTYNSAGQHQFLIPIDYTNAFLKVSNQCGENQIPITQIRCKNKPYILEVTKSISGNTINVVYGTDPNGDVTISLYAYGASSPSYSVTLPYALGVQSYTFGSLPPTFVSGIVDVRVSNQCGTAQNLY